MNRMTVIIMTKYFYVYIMSNTKDGVLYIGVTSDLIKRVFEHKNKITKGFTSKYNLDKLVYFEVYDDIETAIKREKRLKFWQRNWKIKLIETINSEWLDLYSTILEDPAVEPQNDATFSNCHLVTITGSLKGNAQ